MILENNKKKFNKFSKGYYGQEIYLLDNKEMMALRHNKCIGIVINNEYTLILKKEDENKIVSISANIDF